MIKSFFIIFISVLIAEIGDKTQLATFGFATNNNSKMLVFLASSIALVTSSAIAVFFGDIVRSYIDKQVIITISGILFIIIGIATLYGVKNG